MKYKTVEIAVRFVSGVAVGEEAVRLTTALSQVERYSPEWYQLDTAQAMFVEKETDLVCLANHIPGLAEATTIVHIPSVSVDGKVLDFEHIQSIFWQMCAEYGVVTHTNSSVKEYTFYMIEFTRWSRLFRYWTDAYKYANYAGLIFSSVTDTELTKVKVNKILTATDGKDGNCAVSAEVWQYEHSCQDRGMQYDAKQDALYAVEKGTGNPRKGIVGIELNDTQVKFCSRTGRGNWYILKNTDVNSKKSKTWLAPQLPLMLIDCEETRMWLRSRVKNAINKEIITTLSNPLQRALRRGALRSEDGIHLDAPRSALEEAFRCNLDMCTEIESRSGRFLVRDAAKIAMSGGVYGMRSLLTISDEFGAHWIGSAAAMILALKGRKVWMLYRDPVNGPERVVFLDKDPYKEGQGYVVDRETADIMNADSDGDTANLVSDVKVVLFYAKWLQNDFVVDTRPTPIKRSAPMSVEKLEDIALETMRNAWVIGTTTIAAWKLMQERRKESAGKMLLFADTAPMILKHHIYIDGKPFMTCVRELLNKERLLLDNTTLKWHEAMRAAQDWDSVKEFAGSMIENPITHMDEMWNAAAESFAVWLKDNPLYELSLSKLGHTISRTVGTIPNYNWYEARENFITPWGEYWQKYIVDGEFMLADHRDFFKEIHEKGKEASLMTLAAVLCWHPLDSDSDGFSLKWHVLFATGRAHELLGYHPDIIKHLKKKGIDLRREEYVSRMLHKAPTVIVEHA